MLYRYLEDLESRIEPGIEDNLLEQWHAFWENRTTDNLFIPARNKCSPSRIDWPEISVNESLKDPDLMLLRELKACSDIISGTAGQLLNIRCNYGTGIMPSLFGAELFIMEERFNTLPATRPIDRIEHKLQAIIDKGIPDVYSGLGKTVFETAEKFTEKLSAYPRIKKYVTIYHPDIQGPMDICEMLYGSGIFLALIDTPDAMHAFLRLITRTYEKFMEEWEKRVHCQAVYSTHWSMLHKGRIMLRDDSAMNLSPGMFKEFIKPCDNFLLNRFGGGAIHFCGRGDHFINHLSGLDNLYAIHMSQPEYNNMETILSHTVDRGIRIIGLPRDTGTALREKGRDLQKSVQCF